MNGAGNFFVRWRVRLGYPLAIAVLYFSWPTPRSILLGALTGVISSQAGSPHRHRPLRLHQKSALSRQRYPGSWGRNCHAVVDLCTNPYCLLRSFLFHGDAQGREGASPAPRGILRRVCARRPAFYSTPDRRETACRLGRVFLSRPIQEKS